MFLRTSALVIGLLLFSQTSLSQLVSAPNLPTKDPVVLRGPFLLKLRIDNQHIYEEHFDRIPYVADDAVYLFSGETFGIDFVKNGSRPPRVIYEPLPAKADVEFHFKQELTPKGFVMMLIIRNGLKETLSFDALMTVPGDKDIHRTDVLPVAAGRTNTEAWPHPIVQLMLRNFRCSVHATEQY